MLKQLVDKKGKDLFIFEELAEIVESQNRQAASQHIEDFRECGEDFGDFLKRRKKVDDEIVEAVRSLILKEPLTPATELCKQVNELLNRSDISPPNVDAALKEIGCNEIRSVLRTQIESGASHYREEYLLKEMMNTLNGGVLEKAGFQKSLTEEPCITDPTAIRKLVTPGEDIEQINPSLRRMGMMMSLYYYGVPLSVLGRWFNVHKTTVLRWIIGLSLCLWPIIYKWILEKVKASKVYVDEKWLKINKKWYYWFVVIDQETEIPILSSLQESRTKWAVEWIGAKLKMLGFQIRYVMSDGLSAYREMVEGAQHLLCHFHYQQGVTRYVKEHFEDPAEIKEKKHLLKKVLQTNDKRTVKRRLEKLEKDAQDLGIAGWIKNTLSKLTSLLPSVGSMMLPRTNNAIERFFRAFNRFYKTRCGFHSVKSAKNELIFFMVVYLFTRQESGIAPIEKIMSEAKDMPLYKIINDPFHGIGSLKFVKKMPPLADFLLAKPPGA